MIKVGQLILVKHAMPVIDPAVPAPDWHLSEDGRVQSARLAERLRKYKPQALFASKEPKARETGKVAGERLGLPVDARAGLEEHHRCNVAFESFAVFCKQVEEFFTNPGELIFGEETAYEAHRRFDRSVRLVMKERPVQNVVIFSHGTVITLFVSRAAGVEPYPLWERLELPSYIVLSWPALELLELVDRID